ncbi:MAG TPA: CoA transferase [Acidimicrobiales bacterium]|nr:CoA transferase [Acidimicrobiales bacterium]
MSGRQRDLVDQAWAAVSLDDPGSHPDPPAVLEVTAACGHLPSNFLVEEVAVASVGAALLAAAALSQQRGGTTGSVGVDTSHVADAVRSERVFRCGGQPGGAGFAPLSRFWAAADGWVRTHANYPWHRKALVGALGTTDEIGAVADAVAELPAVEVEQRVFDAGGIATAVGTLDGWHAHPQGRAVAAEPLIGHRMTGAGSPRWRAAAGLPMAGVRVLDLTRVIAGPVCTRFLAALGAEVLRLDPPGHPDMAAGDVADTLLGKKSAFLDLGTRDAAAVLERLLDRADVVVSGYRPGALDRFGLGEESLTERHPGIVAIYLDAWGHHGPWAGRRGFDSVVQAPTGIAMGESPDGHQPGALPCQVLDHGTGYLAAAAALDGLRRQGEVGGTHVRRLSLARTALWLTAQGTSPHRGDGSAATEPETPARLVRLDSARGAVTAVAPPGTLGDRPLRWPSPLTAYGSDPAAWTSG